MTPWNSWCPIVRTYYYDSVYVKRRRHMLNEHGSEIPNCMIRNDFNHVMHLISTWSELKSCAYRIKQFYMKSILVWSLGVLQKVIIGLQMEFNKKILNTKIEFFWKMSKSNFIKLLKIWIIKNIQIDCQYFYQCRKCIEVLQ